MRIQMTINGEPFPMEFGTLHPDPLRPLSAPPGNTYLVGVCPPPGYTLAAVQDSADGHAWRTLWGQVPRKPWPLRHARYLHKGGRYG